MNESFLKKSIKKGELKEFSMQPLHRMLNSVTKLLCVSKQYLFSTFSSPKNSNIPKLLSVHKEDYKQDNLFVADIR
jgi:hypothetical protein